MSATRFRFSKKAIDDLVPGRSRQYYFDTIVTALAVLVTPAGSKSFYLCKKIRGKPVRVRIAGVHEVPIERARLIAAERLVQLLAGGEAPAAGRATGAAEAQPAVLPKAETLTLGQVMAEYLEYLREHKRPSSVLKYTQIFARHLAPFADREIASFRRREISQLHVEIGRGSGHHMANRTVAMLRAVLNRAIKEHDLDIPNPAAGITFYNEQQRSRRLQTEELPAFFEAVHAEPNANIREFVLLSLFTGARKANLLAMQWSHVSLDRGIWIVPAAEAKSNREMPIVLPTAAVEILTDRRARIEGPFVFPGRRGADHMMDPKIGWQRILTRAGLENLRMHDLRRTLASFQIDTGSTLEVIQKTLGHGSKSTTEIYARMAMAPVKESVERAVEEMLSGSNPV